MYQFPFTLRTFQDARPPKCLMALYMLFSHRRSLMSIAGKSRCVSQSPLGSELMTAFPVLHVDPIAIPMSIMSVSERNEVKLRIMSSSNVGLSIRTQRRQPMDSPELMLRPPFAHHRPHPQEASFSRHPYAKMVCSHDRTIRDSRRCPERCHICSASDIHVRPGETSTNPLALFTNSRDVAIDILIVSAALRQRRATESHSLK
ncbi:hypothetical protein L226DRAFT_321329 [Lentinus tigrinus ALCF2SS1-7]|uniref:uncharacterized protein n=1 Tax=Lentinus tigrinus ALCF2SS1-7 TaxID=1328758 RepID=UPI001165ECC3|nr:hypothetical protein L226DRAFT_321329 [Lentinus tigrinus ALCF2SS1-7]